MTTFRIRMGRGLAALFLVVAFAGPAQAQQSFQDGVAAYDRGDYATAFQIMKTFAEQGDATAQFNLGLMYRKGQGVPQDYGEAVKWYRKAADQGTRAECRRITLRPGKRSTSCAVPTAQNNLGVMYESGRGVVQDYVEAVKWYRKAAEQGNAMAQERPLPHVPQRPADLLQRLYFMRSGATGNA